LRNIRLPPLLLQPLIENAGYGWRTAELDGQRTSSQQGRCWTQLSRVS